MLVPFYALLPDDLAFPVARAYSRLHIFKSKPAILATEEPDEVPNAFKALVRYAVEQLDLDFPVPEITEPGSQPTS